MPSSEMLCIALLVIALLCLFALFARAGVDEPLIVTDDSQDGEELDSLAQSAPNGLETAPVLLNETLGQQPQSALQSLVHSREQRPLDPIQRLHLTDIAPQTGPPSSK